MLRAWPNLILVCALVAWVAGCASSGDEIRSDGQQITQPQMVASVLSGLTEGQNLRLHLENGDVVSGSLVAWDYREVTLSNIAIGGVRRRSVDFYSIVDVEVESPSAGTEDLRF